MPRLRLSMLPALLLVLVTTMLAAALPTAAQSQALTGREIDWEKYMQKGANATAIALALSYVETCSNKLTISETSEANDGGEKITLSFACEGSEDEEAGAYVVFWKGTDGMIFDSIGFAG